MFIDVWINCPDRAVADRIAEACINERLAACANIFPPIFSLYRWQGAIERADEIPLLLKSKRPLFEKLCQRVQALHPYDIPSIVACDLPLVDQLYGEWIDQETQG